MREIKKKPNFLHLEAFFHLYVTFQNASKQLSIQAQTYGENNNSSLLRKKINMYFQNSFLKMKKEPIVAADIL